MMEKRICTAIKMFVFLSSIKKHDWSLNCVVGDCDAYLCSSNLPNVLGHIIAHLQANLGNARMCSIKDVKF